MTGTRPATSRLVRTLPWVAAAVASALVIASVILLVLTFDEPRPARYARSSMPAEVLTQLTTLAIVGLALVLTRSAPRNAFGWFLFAAAVGFPLFDTGESLALLGDPHQDTWALAAAWTTNWTWGLTTLSVPFILLLFPTGRPPTSRWRLVAWVAAANAAVIALLTMLYPGPLDAFPEITNPLGWGVIPAGQEGEALPGPFVPLHFLLVVVSLASLVFRYRRAGGVERRQIGWVVYGCVVFVATLLASTALPPFLGVTLDVFGGVVLGITILVAMLRYRLYEIDRIVNRTVTYALVSAVLAGLYVVVVVLPSMLFEFESDLLVAAATLAAAAAFGPVRRRTQNAVDRIFNRARYDAARVVERFGVRAREATDLDALVSETGLSVARTVQPDSVWLWLKNSEENVNALP